ncbi:MAG: UbiD family decarboxylase, partial [Planctomycetes bacterium]|nr:UbiD family decarboxylase [Planctomycetota bacterium]
MKRLPKATPLADLRALLAVLRREGELVEIDAELDPDLEIAEVHRRVIAAGGPALLFLRVKGSPWPLVTNLFGTQRRVELAFGPRPEALIERLAALPHEALPPTVSRLWAQRDLAWALTKVGLRRRAHGPVTACVDRPPRLSRLPLLKTWQKDGGPFVTLPLVLTEHPAGLGTNLGMYRIQRFDDDRCGLHMQIQRGGGVHLAEHERLGRAMPVAVHIGGPPALVLGAIAPLPENLPELLLSSLAMGRRLEVARTPHSRLDVALRSEFALLGDVQPGARHLEGPFGDHYGYYSLQHPYPRLDVHTLLHREDPICTATVVGKPRQEDAFLGDWLQRLLLPMVKLAMPAVRELWAYGETGYHSLAAAIVAERYRREAMVSAFRVLGEGQLSLTKFLLVTDRAVDLRDARATLAHVLARANLATDLFVFANLAMDTLDYTGLVVNEGSKGVLLGLGDAVRLLPERFEGAALPAGFRHALPFCPGCLVVDGPAHAKEPHAAKRLAASNALDGWPLVVLCDDAPATTRTIARFLWTTFTRFEPARDLVARTERLEHNHVVREGPLVIDARMKA